jgi:hypothetical protein
MERIRSLFHPGSFQEWIQSRYVWNAPCYQPGCFLENILFLFLTIMSIFNQKQILKEGIRC